MALWGIRTLVSWGLLAASFMFLVVFAWPVASGSFPSGLGLVIFYVTEPITQFVTQFVGPVRVGNWDPVPLVLAVALLILRPYLTGPLWQLEKEARQRAAMPSVPE
jgi:hypothetical protein